MIIRFSVTLLIYTSRCSHDGKDAVQKTLAQHLARRNEANMSTSFKFAQEEEPDPKKKPDSKKKKHPGRSMTRWLALSSSSTSTARRTHLPA